MKANFRKAGAVTRRVTNLRMYGEIVGRRMGLTVKPGKISTGATDGKTVVINFAAFSEDPDAVVLLDGTCTHEFGHIRYTDFLAKRSILKRPLALSFYRALEDGRMEACERRDYPGMAVRIEAALEVMVKRGLFSLPSADEPVESLIPNMLLSWVRGHYLQQRILEPMYKARMAMLCNLVGMPVIKGFLDIARDGLERARSTQDIVTCSVALEEYLQREQQTMENQQTQAGKGDSIDDSSDDTPNGTDESKQSGSKAQDDSDQDQDQKGIGSKQSDPSQGDADDASDNGNGASQGSNSEDNDNSGNDAESGSKGQGDDENSLGGNSGKQETGQNPEDPTQGSGSSQQGEQDDGTQPQASGASASEDSSGTSDNGANGLESGIPSGGASGDDVGEDLDQAIKALAQLLGASDLPETDLGNLLQETIDQVAPASNVIDIREKRPFENAAELAQYAGLTRQIELRVASHLEVLLESRLEERSQIERAGRRLSTRHLARVQTSPVPRVFRIDEEISGISTAVSVLLDVSASMEHTLSDGVTRLHAAVASARAAVSAMDRHEVPCSLHFFGEFLTPVKGFDEAWRRVRDQHWYDTESNTLTGHAVERVVPVLATRDEERKLLLLVTDGFPAEPDRTAAALQTCESFGVETAILLINSGQGAEKVQLERFTQLLDSFGLSWIEVNTTDQLADGLMQAIRDAV